MRWSPRCAHLLLQIRTRVLDHTLADGYRCWYPGFAHTPDWQDQAAWPPTVCPALPLTGAPKTPGVEAARLVGLGEGPLVLALQDEFR
jgi:hypothetical protein